MVLWNFILHCRLIVKGYRIKPRVLDIKTKLM